MTTRYEYNVKKTVQTIAVATAFFAVTVFLSLYLPKEDTTSKIAIAMFAGGTFFFTLIVFSGTIGNMIEAFIEKMDERKTKK